LLERALLYSAILSSSTCFFPSPKCFGFSTVGVNHVVREDRVADALNLAPVLGLSWGDEDKKFQDLVEATVPKVKGMRELKNLDCAISPVKGKRRRGWSGSKNAFSFPPEVH
jgi:hypothetical protein